MAITAVLLATCLWLQATFASVTIRKTSQGPTGYEIDFHYYNTTASAVTIAGGLTTFTDQFHAVVQGSASYDPRNYQPGWFRGVGANNTPAFLPFHMDSDGNGNWNYTTPMPSGTYAYAFLVDCPVDNNTCTVDSGRYVIDADNPPFNNVQGDQIQSRFQVPFDARFQTYADLNLNFDCPLPVAEGN